MANMSQKVLIGLFLFVLLGYFILHLIIPVIVYDSYKNELDTNIIAKISVIWNIVVGCLVTIFGGGTCAFLLYKLPFIDEFSSGKNSSSASNGFWSFLGLVGDVLGFIAWNFFWDFGIKGQMYLIWMIVSLGFPLAIGILVSLFTCMILPCVIIASDKV